ncbi:MAG: hypothetical protein COV96_01335 [Candidatus Zambryskibacteria bacterium CG11_big_fil_rev_8_21_14_0_20_42_18]|nr:MAG: hypothetical protein COV96_01335 [Candidatus Zambryskibacteria bacterium CG11_big_fil_rev_8_21_14_0_20_42_18]
MKVPRLRGAFYFVLLTQKYRARGERAFLYKTTETHIMQLLEYINKIRISFISHTHIEIW